jgi:hypothetical protein
MNNQRVCMRISTKGSKGTPFCTACSPLYHRGKEHNHGSSRRKATDAESYVGGVEETR